MDIVKGFVRLQRLLLAARAVDFLAPLALRLYLVPIFWMAGTRKLGAMESTIAWFGNPEWGLGLPFPAVQAWLATLAEVGGAVALLIGLATRWAVLPLMVTMVVAAVKVHGANGWLAIATGSGLFATERTIGAVERLSRAKEILRAHGNYEWLTEMGNFVVLNNGIEFVATYFIMLMVLFFTGGGRYMSVDHWLGRWFLAHDRP
jgi:putative oxidoreductase